MDEQWQIVDLATIARLCKDRDEALAQLHTRNGELMVARMELDMLRDDVKRAIALLPADPGAALGMLVAAVRETNHETA